MKYSTKTRHQGINPLDPRLLPSGTTNLEGRAVDHVLDVWPDLLPLCGEEGRLHGLPALAEAREIQLNVNARVALRLGFLDEVLYDLTARQYKALLCRNVQTHLHHLERLHRTLVPRLIRFPPRALKPNTPTRPRPDRLAVLAREGHDRIPEAATVQDVPRHSHFRCCRRRWLSRRPHMPSPPASRVQACE